MAENVFEAVKQSVSTREAAEFYGIKVRRNGMACCPFHDDKNPSMKVDQRFHCFGCGEDGDVIDFTAKLFDLSPKEAAEKLAQDFGLIYDSQAPPRRRYVRQKTEAQKFREDRQRCYRVLSDYYYLLKKWEADRSPRTPEEEPHPRFVEAIQKKAYVEYLLDLFLYESEEEQKAWIAEHTAEITHLERRLKIMAENKPTNRERLREITDGIEQGIKELFESEKYMRYLSVMSRFHRYSVNNTMLKCNDTRRLKWSGVTPKYNFRFADDWVILTSTEQEAYRLKRMLTKYFRNKMKLELSQEKTFVTDLRTEGIHFLGFVVKAEKKRRTPDPRTWTDNLVGKPLPDMERLKDKIQKIANEVREIGEITERSVQAAQIQRVNSMIVGLAQYLQPSICSHAFHAIDRRINNTALAVWKRRFPKHYNKYQIPLEKLCNLPHRHEGYKSKTFAVPIEGEWFGITYAFITHSKYESKPFDQRMTPYSEEGRRIYSYYRNRSKPLPCDRPSVNTARDIQLSVYTKTVFNFEYFMNREYAYNRDNGKCKCCKTPLFLDDKKYCYHIKGELPLDKVNKVQNLIWLCNSCYRMVNNGPIPPNIDEKVLKRIEKYKQK